MVSEGTGSSLAPSNFARLQRCLIAGIASGIRQVAAKCEGYRGYVAMPQAPESNERHLAVRFASMDHLNAYWDSEEAQAWRTKLAEFTTAPSEFRPEVGIEHWCMSPNTAIPPSRHRMTVAVFAALLPLVMLVPPRLKPWLAEYVPDWIAGTITTAVMVLIMSYVAMPLVTHVLRGWLHPESKRWAH